MWKLKPCHYCSHFFCTQKKKKRKRQQCYIMLFGAEGTIRGWTLALCGQHFRRFLSLNENKWKTQEAVLHCLLLRNASSFETSACSHTVFLRLCMASIRHCVGFALDGKLPVQNIIAKTNKKRESAVGFLRKEWLWGGDRVHVAHLCHRSHIYYQQNTRCHGFLLKITWNPNK